MLMTSAVDAHRRPLFAFAYEHTADRLAERYRLFLTPEVWDAWHAAINSGSSDALYVGKARIAGGSVWRVKMDDVAVFVVMDKNVIRTVLPRTGWHIEHAREAAAAIGETSLGLKLPPPGKRKQQKAPLEPSQTVPALRMMRETQMLHEQAHKAKMERIRHSNEQTRSQAQLFVRTVRSMVTKEEFVKIWEKAKEMFPDDPAWN